MKNVVFWDIQNSFRTSQETHYVSATEPSRLMLCKIWGFHGGDYEECRLLRYKNPVRTSHETHYVSATEPSQLMLCKIWGFHGSDYEEWSLLGRYAVWPFWEFLWLRHGDSSGNAEEGERLPSEAVTRGYWCQSCRSVMLLLLAMSC
jgi:hypothetical protein